MAYHRAIPLLLQSYFELPRELSTVLLTSVLGASTNWLIERYIVATLSRDTDHEEAVAGQIDGQQEPERRHQTASSALVLVSWMRDYETWRAEVRRASGLDIAKAVTEGRFAFIDGLSGSAAAANNFNSGGSLGVGNQTAAISNLSPGSVPQPHPSGPHGRPLDPVSAVEGTFDAALRALQKIGDGRKVLLILDQPDIAFATSAASLQLPDLLASITALSRSSHSTIISLGADSPLVAAATAALSLEEGARPSAFAPLESQHAALLASLVHRASHVLQLRKLETGWARDVSGVLRICRGGGWEDGDGGQRGAEGFDHVEKELLYHVKGDGSVRVFERGAYASD